MEIWGAIYTGKLGGLSIPPSRGNLIFTVIGEAVNGGLVRVWLTDNTLAEIARTADPEDTEAISDYIINSVSSISIEDVAEAAMHNPVKPVLITDKAYELLKNKIPSVNDEQSFRLLISLNKQTGRQ